MSDVNLDILSISLLLEFVYSVPHHYRLIIFRKASKRHEAEGKFGVTFRVVVYLFVLSGASIFWGALHACMYSMTEMTSCMSFCLLFSYVFATQDTAIAFLIATLTDPRWEKNGPDWTGLDWGNGMDGSWN